MISLPLPAETEQLIVLLSNQEKKTLTLMIQAFVAKPNRSMAQVIDDMAAYAKRQGLTPDKLNDLLKEE